ncbi:RidA family protein [Mycobacteroides abscessus]|nr:RidA family protein [Mycobacteroides abscessus]MDM1905914.1 RidA family protein [Mycobacteroides abscessus]MDM1910687.1 RidA family protein [Mycobacteroides abscessus]MDM1919325.1 RidA family protein [Mycobacteroides abscessus]
MLRNHLNPAILGLPSTYNHGVEISGVQRCLFISGQVGIRPDGSVPEGIIEQTYLAVSNLKLVLGAAGMSLKNVVKETIYLRSSEDLAGFVAAKSDSWGSAFNPASTLLYVDSFVGADLRVEIDAIAVDHTTSIPIAHSVKQDSRLRAI